MKRSDWLSNVELPRPIDPKPTGAKLYTKETSPIPQEYQTDAEFHASFGSISGSVNSDYETINCPMCVRMVVAGRSTGSSTCPICAGSGRYRIRTNGPTPGIPYQSVGMPIEDVMTIRPPQNAQLQQAMSRDSSQYEIRDPAMRAIMAKPETIKSPRPKSKLLASIKKFFMKEKV